MFYYLFFRNSSVEINFKNSFTASLSYVILPLLPVSFTFFWKFITLSGTISFLKMVKCLRKIISLNEQEGKHDSAEYKSRLSLKRDSILKIERSLDINKSKRYKKEANDILEHDEDEEVKEEEPKSSLNLNLGTAIYTKNGENLDKTETSLIRSNKENLNADVMSELIELTSIESLLATVPFDNIKSSKENCFIKFFKRLEFYFKMTKSILFLNDYDFMNDPDLRNASFVYYSNFMVGLGIITVCNLFLIILVEF